jgi:hypothetical protein
MYVPGQTRACLIWSYAAKWTSTRSARRRDETGTVNAPVSCGSVDCQEQVLVYRNF